MSTIATKTGPGENDRSTCRAVLEICDDGGNCCQTSADGRGLYSGQIREIGQTDVYTDTTILGNCAQEVRNIHFDPNPRLPDKPTSVQLSESRQYPAINCYIFPFCVQGILVGSSITATLTISDPDAHDGDFSSNIIFKLFLLKGGVCSG